MDPRDFPAPQQTLGIPVVFSARQRGYLRVKRVVDACGALAALLVLALPMTVTALAIRITMGAPVVFRQTRITTDGRLFRLFKFRSMRNIDPAGGSVDDAQRITRLGSLLRATSIDELPSLFNILRGDMSFVGPRPLTADYLGRFDRYQFSRHAVRAGLTGLAQVSGRNLVAWDDRFALDRQYVAGIGAGLDARILLRTVVIVGSSRRIDDGATLPMTDFPGPLRTKGLEFHGFESDGTWSCAQTHGRTVACGRARPAGQVLEVTLSAGTGTAAAGQTAGADRCTTPFDDVLALLLAHARRDGWEWVRITGADPRADLRAPLRLAGFVAQSTSACLPALAFVGFRP